MRDFENYAGFRRLSVVKETGTVSVLYEANEAGLDPAGGRWATVCEDHGAICNHPTRRLADRHLPYPDGWCEDCRDILRARGVM